MHGYCFRCFVYICGYKYALWNELMLVKRIQLPYFDLLLMFAQVNMAGRYISS